MPKHKLKNDSLGETDRKSIERTIAHNKYDKKSHLLKHAHDENHTDIWEQDFKFSEAIINYKNKNQ